MAITSVNIRALNQDEHNEDAHAKRVIIRGQNPDDGEFYNIAAVDNGDGTFSLSTCGGATSSGGKATDAYGIQAISDDGTYKYFFFEDASANYYILRKHIANKVFDYTKGTGGYASVYVSSSAGPSGSPTWDSYGDTF